MTGSVRQPVASSSEVDNDRICSLPPLYMKEESNPKQWKKFLKYDLEVDKDQGDKAKEILLCMFHRPHMRAFHCAWWSLFVAYINWFSISPLLPYIRTDLNLSNADIWTSSIASVGGTVFIRLLVGPLCDMFGPRAVFTGLLCTSAISTGCTGLINNAQGLVLVRLFIGFIGGSVVPSLYWSCRMFTNEVVGTASGLVAGWGDLGAGVTRILMGSILMPIFRSITGSDDMAWRTVCIVPALMAFATGVTVYFISDDCPKGNYRELKARGQFQEIKPVPSFVQAFGNVNTWILFIQYACSLGVELTMYNAAAMYFHDQLGQSNEVAQAMSGMFGWLNLFARGTGGVLSDLAFSKFGMKGRIWTQAIALLLEGIFVFIFSQCHALGGSLTTLVTCSLFMHVAEGANFSIVPHVDPRNLGSASGIVAAGGSVGAACFAVAFRELDYEKALFIMGSCVLGASFLSLFLVIKGHSGIIWGRDEFVGSESDQLLNKADFRDEASGC